MYKFADVILLVWAVVARWRIGDVAASPTPLEDFRGNLAFVVSNFEEDIGTSDSDKNELDRPKAL